MDKFEATREEVKARFNSARGSHDWDHVERVFNLAMQIAKKEGADLEVVKYAAILHDIGREEQDRSGGKICHAEYGAKLAREILKKNKFDSEFINKVVHCIETHRFRKNNPPVSLEAKVLFDADKLDSIGAVGIGRAFIWSGEVGGRVHDKNVNLSPESEYTKDDTAYREFMVKLIKVKDRMLTNIGREFAELRHEFMVNFFEQLNDEVEGII